MKKLSRLLSFFDDSAQQWLEQTPLAVLLLDARGRILWANSRQIAFTKVPADVQGRLLREVLPQNFDVLLRALAMVIRSGQSWRQTLSVAGTDRQDKEIDVALAPLDQSTATVRAMMLVDRTHAANLLDQAIDFLTAHLVPADTASVSRDRPEESMLARGLQGDAKATGRISTDLQNKPLYSMPMAQLVAAKQEMQQKLSRNLAHDLRNEISLILHLISEMRKIGESPALQQMLDQINEQVKNLSEIALRLRRVAADYPTDVMPINLSALLRAAVKLAELLCPVKEPMLKCAIQDPVPEYYGNSEGLLSAFTAVLVNALEAVNSAGQVSVSMHFDVGKDGYQICIADDGIGIPAENLAKIFDVYFTTKAGKRAGHSMAIAYRVVQQHLGFIQVTSEPNVGTQVRISLPARRDPLPLSDWNQPAV